MKAVESFKELQRRVEITSRARYHAARRLNAHGIFSQWTLALLAIGQIVITLIQNLGIKINFDLNYLNFMNLFFAVLVLAYSLLLGMGNHVARSIKMHLCGLELGKLARELHFISTANSGNEKKYIEKADSYYSILEKCENHTRADYLVAISEQYKYFKEPNKNNFFIFKERFCIWFWHFIQFFHYGLSVLFLGVWIYYLVIP